LISERDATYLLSMTKLDRDQLQKDIQAQYKAEHDALGESGTMALLEQGRQWDMSNTLNQGGILVFPHAGVADCGHQIAAAVHACLDSGADRVLVISVLHAFTDEMETARQHVAQGDVDLTQEPLRGIQGTGLGTDGTWHLDHALYSFRHFWQAETQRRGIQGPEVIERYPYLAGGHPETLPGIEEVQELSKDAVIVSTADPFHHGIGYGDSPEDTYDHDDEGLAYAQQKIQEGIDTLSKGDYWGYNQHCVNAKSDARDAGQVFRYIRGPMNGHIVNMAYTDASKLYNAPQPTWVAAPLIEWTLV
jgi:hypothetical protein